jgi:hypothetical protein
VSDQRHNGGSKKTFLQSNENEKTKYTVKAILRGKFIAMSEYTFKKSEKSQINNLMMSLKLFKKNKANPELLDGNKQ